MTHIAFCSVKGAPGVTTASQAIAVAVSCRGEEKVLLVEADPFGGDLAARYGAHAPRGLSGLFAAARRGVTPEMVWEYTESLPCGLSVLFGMGGPDQAVANEGTWPAVAGALDELGCDVVLDVGRLLPNFAGGIAPILGHTDTVVLVTSPTLDSMVHVKAAVAALSNAVGTKRLLVVPTATKGYGAAQIETTLRVNVGRPLPFDPAGVAALFAGNSKKLAKSPLFKWATAMASDLGLVRSVPATTATATATATPTAPHPTAPQPTDPAVNGKATTSATGSRVAPR